MEAEAIVKGIDGRYAVVELTEGSSGCGRCCEPGGCGSDLLMRPFRRGCRVVRVENSINAKPGERVRLRLPARTLLHAVLVAYLLPVALVIAGAAAGMALDASHGDGAAVAGAVTGLAVTLAASFWFRHKTSFGRKFRPILYRDRIT